VITHGRAPGAPQKPGGGRNRAAHPTRTTSARENAESGRKAKRPAQRRPTRQVHGGR
jgi:hypothetical protein